VEPLRDSWGREIKSVRVSVTDKCNFRCTYCMPAEGLQWLGREEILTFEEIARLVRVLARLGVDEVRLTGGEPLVRRELPRLVEQLAGIEGVRDLSLTTNGVLLDRLAGPLVAAGLQRLNVSLDTLNHVRFAEITRRDALDAVLRGLEEAERYPQLRPIKVNCVAVKGFTETEVPALAELARRKPYVVRFIEFMPLDADEAWREDDVLSGAEIRAIIEEHYGPARGAAGEGIVDGAPVPLHGRSGRARLRQPCLGAVLLHLRPHPPDRRRAAAHMSLLPPRVGSEGAAPRRLVRRAARGAAPLRHSSQRAQAPHQRPRLCQGKPLDVADRGMMSDISDV
jgi:pyruvate-formate lyase-activating enzyme